jgi:outer membrane protein assembly factor BamB
MRRLSDMASLLPAAFVLASVAGVSAPSAEPARAPEAPKGYGWRGDGSGVFPKCTPPIEWNGEPKKNILWSAKVGVSKFSSPIVVGDKVFVVAEPAELICLDAASGKVLWQKPNGFSELAAKTEETKAKGSPGNVTPTPVSDGRYVYASFGCGIVGCYDLDGTRQWLVFLDFPPGTQYGRSASPLLAGDKLLVSIHHLIALEAKTGKVVWQNEKVPERYGTPAVARIGALDVVLAPSGQAVRLKDGVTLGKVPPLVYATPLVKGNVAYFVGPTTTALELSAPTEDALKTKILWETDLDGTFYASPVCDGGLFFAACNEGSFYVLDAGDGKILLTKELDIPSAAGRDNMPAANIYPSLSLAGRHLFLSNDIGYTIVLEPAREYREVRRNRLLEGSGGTPAFAGGRMFARDGQQLLCIGER